MIAWSLLSLFILLILSGFFSSVETAFTSLSDGQVSHLAEEKGKRGRLVKKLTKRPDILLTTLLIGNNFANLGASALVTTLTIRFLGNAYIALATGTLTLTVLVFCEVAPKQIALMKAEPIAVLSARFVWFLSWILRPIIGIVSLFSRFITRLFAGSSRPLMKLEHILHQVKAAEDQGIVESFEEEMIRNVFRINDTPVEAIMTHRTELCTLGENQKVGDALDELLTTGHSRAPVVKENTEHVSGVVTLGDLAQALRASRETLVKNCASPPVLVPGTLKAHELFFRLKTEPIHLAVVLDEYGGLNGVVTREDVMEEIFGELYDEREPELEDPIIPDGTGAWIIQGDANFYDVNDTIGLRLEHDSRTHTVGGYLLEKLEHIPATGASIELEEGTYTTLEIRKQRIVKVHFRPASRENG